MTNINTHVGARLRDARLRAGLTQTDLSRACLIPIGDLAEYEDGTKRPRAPVLYDLAQALGCKISDFFKGISK